MIICVIIHDYVSCLWCRSLFLCCAAQAPSFTDRAAGPTKIIWSTRLSWAAGPTKIKWSTRLSCAAMLSRCDSAKRYLVIEQVRCLSRNTPVFIEQFVVRTPSLGRGKKNLTSSNSMGWRPGRRALSRWGTSHQTMSKGYVRATLPFRTY